jgi:hypothetical protein
MLKTVKFREAEAKGDLQSSLDEPKTEAQN